MLPTSTSTVRCAVSKLNLDAPAEQIRAATRDAFSNLVDLALREQVAFVLIAGDLFDGEWPDWRTGQFLIREIRQACSGRYPHDRIRGNHDAESIITRRLPKETIQIRSGLTSPNSFGWQELGVCIHGQSFATREVTENLARNYPAPLPGHFNIGLLHTAAGGSDGHANYAPCSVDQLAAHGYDHWALGHVHRREVLLRDPCWIVFSGNTQGRHIGETGAKGASLVTVQDGASQRSSIASSTWSAGRCSITTCSGCSRHRCRLGHRPRPAGCRAGRSRRAPAGRSARVERGVSGAQRPGARSRSTRDMLRVEAAAAAGTGAIWLEGVQVRTRPALDIAAMRERSDAVGMLVREIDGADPERFVEPMKQYFTGLLDKASGLPPALQQEHPAIFAAAGAVSPSYWKAPGTCCWPGWRSAEPCA